MLARGGRERRQRSFIYNSVSVRIDEKIFSFGRFEHLIVDCLQGRRLLLRGTERGSLSGWDIKLYEYEFKSNGWGQFCRWL